MVLADDAGVARLDHDPLTLRLSERGLGERDARRALDDERRALGEGVKEPALHERSAHDDGVARGDRLRVDEVA